MTGKADFGILGLLVRRPVWTADEQGPPRLQPGQYAAWVTGRTAIGTEQEQDALIQMIRLPVTRDVTSDHRREGDPEQVGLFVIDQHGAQDPADGKVGGSSAGCLVGRDQAGHNAFMAALRTDSRWLACNAYRFMTSVLTRAELEAGAAQA